MVDILTPDVAVSLSRRTRESSSGVVAAALYQDGDVASAILIREDGSLVDAPQYVWADGSWAIIPEEVMDYTTAGAAGIWPSKANGGTIRARVAGRDVSIPVGTYGYWTFITRVPDIRQPGNVVQFLEEPDDVTG